MTRRNKELALEFMAANDRNDASALLAMYADDGIHIQMGRTPISGTFTKEQMQAAAGAIFEAFPDGKPAEVVGIVAEGDTVAVEVDSVARHRSGKVYHQQLHWVLKFRDGQLVKTKEYLDTQLVVDVLCGGSTAAAKSPDDAVDVLKSN